MLAVPVTDISSISMKQPFNFGACRKNVPSFSSKTIKKPCSLFHFPAISVVVGGSCGAAGAAIPSGKQPEISGKKTKVLDSKIELSGLLKKYNSNFVYYEIFEHPTNHQGEFSDDFLPLIVNSEEEIVSFLCTDEDGNLLMTITYKNNAELRINGIRIKLPESDVTLIR